MMIIMACADIYRLMNSQPHISSLITLCKVNMGIMAFRSSSGIGVLAFIFNMDCAGEIAGKRR